MIKVAIDLERSGQRWRVSETSISYDDQESQQLGPMNEWLSYEEAVKEAKRWAMLKIRHKGRSETEDDVFWKINPPEVM